MADRVCAPSGGSAGPAARLPGFGLAARSPAAPVAFAAVRTVEAAAIARLAPFALALVWFVQIPDLAHSRLQEVTPGIYSRNRRHSVNGRDRFPAPGVMRWNRREEATRAGLSALFSRFRH